MTKPAPVRGLPGGNAARTRIEGSDGDDGAKARALALHRDPEVVAWDRAQMRKGRTRGD